MDFEPGPIILFNPLIIHKSVMNKSNKARFIYGADIQDIAAIPLSNDEDILGEIVMLNLEKNQLIKDAKFLDKIISFMILEVKGRFLGLSIINLKNDLIYWPQNI